MDGQYEGWGCLTLSTSLSNLDEYYNVLFGTWNPPMIEPNLVQLTTIEPTEWEIEIIETKKTK